MPSATYKLFAQAMKTKQHVLCSYDGFPRAVCVVILGHRDGEEWALVFQFAGTTSQGPMRPPGDWKCFRVSKVTNARMRAGPWHAGTRHKQDQICVDDVDLDINPASPYNPRRRLEDV